MISAHPGQFKVITCFLPAGKGQGVLERLYEEMQVSSAYAHHARGTGLSTRRNKRVPEYVEREMISALVPAERADEVFRFIFYAAGIDQPHAGMVMMTSPTHAALLVLPEETPEEED